MTKILDESFSLICDLKCFLVRKQIICVALNLLHNRQGMKLEHVL